MIGALRPRLVVTAAVALFIFLSFYLLHDPASAGGSSLPRFALFSSSSYPSSSSSAKAAAAAAGNAGNNDKPYGRAYKGQSTPEDINRVTNGTLGFGKVFVVGLPERTDKRDAMALTSSLTGFDVEWVDGWHGQDIPDKAVPFGVDRGMLMETNLGSWRGHMDAVRR